MGADLEQTCNKGRGLVWYGVWNSCTNVLGYVLERGCSANDDTLILDTVSEVLAGRETTLLLLDAGACIEKQDEQGRTLLKIAFDEKDQDVTEMLLERGASLKGAGLDDSQCRHLVSSLRVDHQDAIL
ncbi:hypothetical protein NCS52_00974000 [Fusarium sp. LHS14.1]|nr:hypothetical protein NCS52_00974000 [Fusarium sp. LHS14.1]